MKGNVEEGGVGWAGPRAQQAALKPAKKKRPIIVFHEYFQGLVFLWDTCPTVCYYNKCGDFDIMRWGPMVPPVWFPDSQWDLPPQTATHATLPWPHTLSLLPHALPPICHVVFQTNNIILRNIIILIIVFNHQYLGQYWILIS